MEHVKLPWYRNHWQLKTTSLCLAVVIWYFVSLSIIATKTVPNIPIRIFNLPHDKTISGLLPNGVFQKRINLSLQGSKDIIEQLESSDLEVQLDASQSPDEWVVQINKKNLISLNPDIDLNKHVQTINQPDLVINLSKLTSAKVPVYLSVDGEAPKGYQFLDIFPHALLQEITGPEEEVTLLEDQGIPLTIDLKRISKNDLDELSTRVSDTHEDEVSFKIPPSWRKINIPHIPYAPQTLNDSLSQQLRIDFLKESLIPLEQNLPIIIHYPLESSYRFNPNTLQVEMGGVVQEKDGIPYFNQPLYISGTSRRFVETVRSGLCIMINALSPTGDEKLSWNVGLVNPRLMEDKYVSAMMSDFDVKENTSMEQREQLLRSRFREYLQNLRLYTGKQNKLTLDCRIVGHLIGVHAQSTRVNENRCLPQKRLQEAGRTRKIHPQTDRRLCKTGPPGAPPHLRTCGTRGGV